MLMRRLGERRSMIPQPSGPQPDTLPIELQSPFEKGVKDKQIVLVANPGV
jgi:hypothetical protein